MDNGLTRRCSEPLAAPRSHFDDFHIQPAARRARPPSLILVSLGVKPSHMEAPTITAITCAILGSALLVAAALLTYQPRQRRMILAYMGVLFYVYGALEFFGIIHLASL